MRKQRGLFLFGALLSGTFLLGEGGQPAAGETPLPGALALFAGGLGVLGALRRRRRVAAR